MTVTRRGKADRGATVVRQASNPKVCYRNLRQRKSDGMEKTIGIAAAVSLQDGVGNVSVLRQRLPGRRVLAAMVPFNVITPGQGRIHRATSGDIVIEQDDAGTAARLSVPGLKMRASDNIAGVQWGK